MYPTISFWDCSEFVSSSHNLSVGHQPGAPLYQLIGSLVSFFCFGHLTWIAPMINGISAVAAGLSIMFLFHLFLYLFNKYSVYPVGNTAAAAISSLTFAFTDSFWSSATEAEVYTLSFLFTTLCLHIIIQWEEKPQEKYLVLLSLVLGMSYGVHPSTLLVLPAIVFIIWFHYRKITFRGIICSILISIGILFIFMNAFDWLISLFRLSIPLTIVGLVFIIGVLLFVSYKKELAFVNSLAFCILFFFIGCSTYAVIAIRSSYSVPGNEYAAYTTQDMHNYISRSAYAHAPILYGPYYTALPCEDFKIKDNKITPVFNKQFNTIFPRMWNYNSASFEDGYTSWVGTPKDTLMISGEERYKPSFWQNINFFLRYQVSYMYVRYLLWNFSGKTNDLQGYGDMSSGQWQTGYTHIDNLLGVDEGRTIETMNNKANNKYFAIPLILCLIGVFYHIIKDSKRFLFVGTIFIMYSLALVVYINVAAYEPRERDYIFLPSFMAISIWIGIGILASAQLIVNLLTIKKPRYALPIFLIVPIWMFLQNFNDHNHHHQYTALNFAISMLNSCDKDAILFVDGDNDTYPLWYAQNVEKIRQDLRVINREMLNNEYYITLLTKAMPDSKPVKLSLEHNNYQDGIMNEVQLTPSFDTISIDKAISMVKNSKNSDIKLGEHLKTLHYNKFTTQIENKDINFAIEDAMITKGDMIVLDIINSNSNRPVYFSAYSNDKFLGLDDYLSLEGFAYKIKGEKQSSQDDLSPIKAGTINANKMYDHIMHDFEFYNFGNNIYFNEIERSIVNMYIENMTSLAYKLVQINEPLKAQAIVNKVCKTFPTDVHYYPYSLADLGIISALCGDSNMGMELVSKGVDSFEALLERYINGTVKFQAQNRLQAAKTISYMLTLCIEAENWGLEQERIALSEAFFSCVRPYLEITYRQKKIMLLEKDYYTDEINSIDNLVADISDFAEHYEEEIPQDNTKKDE